MPVVTRAATTRTPPTTRAMRARTAATLVRLGSQYVLLSALKHVVPLRRLARAMWVDAAPRDPARAARALAAVPRLRRVLGGTRGDCLQSALVLYRELSASGLNPVLAIGFARAEGRTSGHAWVELDGVAAGEAQAAVAPYEVAVTFGRGGVPRNAAT